MRLLILCLLLPFIAQTQELSKYEKLVAAASVLASDNAYDKAIRSLDEAIKMDSTQLSAYYERGKVKYNMNAYEAAIIDFEKVLMIKPSYYFSYVYIADCKMKLGDFKGAKEAYQQTFKYKHSYKFRSTVFSKYKQAKLAEKYQAEAKLDTEAIEVNFQGQIIVLGASDILNCNETTLNTIPLEEESQLLDVNFTMSDDPIATGLFIFGIETENDKNLSLELFEKKTDDLLLQCTFKITEGNNYKGMNVAHIASGAYTLRIYDEDKKALYRDLYID